MKKRQIIAMLSCLMVGMVGFAGAYTMERAKTQEQQQNLQAMLSELEDTEELSQVSSVIQPEDNTEDTETMKEIEPETEAPEPEEEPQEPEKKEPAKETVAEDTAIHFSPEDGLRWPLEGDVLLNYSMDHTIYFPTLAQYQYNPALVIGGDVNSKVYVIAKGMITSISENEETGCTVKQDLGDGYTAIYGQLKEVNFAVGDMVERGHVIGYVSEPTKYYSLEGSNLYFAMEKDGVPINPLDYFD